MNAAYAAAKAQHEAEGEQYRRVVDALPPALRQEWAQVEESYEFFDGEWWAALGVLARFLEDKGISTRPRRV